MMPPVVWAQLNTDPPMLHRSYSSGKEESSPLEVGPEGFATACFGEEVVVTSVPNLVLEAKVKGMSAKSCVLKKPSAGPAASVEHEPSPLYCLLYYKKPNCVGVREKTGPKRQLLSFGGMKCTLNREQLFVIGAQVIDMLVKGTPPADCKVWAMNQL